jgi:hypothetical protein
MIVHAIQSHSSYDPGKKSILAIKWAEDVVGDSGRPPEIKPDLKSMVRAVFSSHIAQLFWQPAFKRLIDDKLVDGAQSLWLDSLKRVSPEEFTERNRAECERLYSYLSKGVHQEFVVDLNQVYDQPTVTQKVTDVIRICACTALVSHKLMTGIASMRMSDALKLFLNIEGSQP